MWIKRREVVVGSRRITSEKLRKDRYREGYARSLEEKRLEGYGDNVKHMWEQMKGEVVESAGELCGSVILGGKNLKSMLWNDAVVKSGCISSRILWIKFKFARVNVCMVMGYGPDEAEGEER